jgi:NADPH:quinone reductase-like Zn-dependent oxidoreductase
VGALTAQGFLRRARVELGAEVLVYGASGSVGTFAVQLAVARGARVTAVCSGANAQLVRELGAAEVIDYTKEDFSAHGPRFDVVFDAVGKAERSRCKRALKPQGRVVTVSRDPGLAEGDLEALRELLESGKLRPVIDRRFPLEEIVEAHRYVEAGHKKGNVVVTVGAPAVSN